MTVAITWGLVGVFVLFLAIGLAIGLIRGVKRSAVHFAFVIASFVVAFFITPPIANVLLNIKFGFDGGSYTLSQYIIKQINFDLSNYGAVEQLVNKLPVALVSPILFLVLSLVCYAIFDIIYLIVARCAFGKKKKDFEKHKPYRIWGGTIGLVEGFLFMVLLFAPLTSLTSTVQEITYVKATSQVESKADSKHLQTIGELAGDKLPTQVVDILKAYNNSIIGKVTGAGGIDDLLFDGLSQVKVQGETITIRKELLAGTKIYDNFVEIYNNAQDKNYDAIKLEDIKKNLSTFLNGGLFKGVVADTAQDFVLNYTEENVKNLPDILKNVLSELRKRLQTENVSFANDLKNDLLKIVDAGDYILDKQLIQKYDKLTDKDAMAILNFINENLDSETFDTILGDVLGLKIVSYSMPALLQFGSDKIADIFDGDTNIKLNTDVKPEEVEGMLKEVKNAIGDLVKLSDLLNLPQLLKAEDKVDFLAKEIETENLRAGIQLAGTTLDELRQLKILQVRENDNTTYVLDEILKHYEFSILGDKVYEMGELNAQEVEIKTYEQFFKHIEEPLLLVKENNLLDALNGDVVNSVLDILSGDTALLAKTILPFKNMQALDLGSMVYDKVVNTLKEQELSHGQPLLNFDYLEKVEPETDTANFERWYHAFTALGETLNRLNSGTVTADKDYTYIKYVLSGSYDQDTLIDTLLADENFAYILNPVFETELFKPLSQMFLDNIDNAVNEITKLTAKSSYDKLKSDKTAAETLKTLLNKIKGLNSDDIDLKTMGEILDTLKTNAKNGGAFETIFCNLVWYLTGDNIGSLDVATKSPISNNTTIKDYLQKDYAGEVQNKETEEFYLDISFTDKFTEIEKAKKIGEELLSAVGDKTVSDVQSAKEFLGAIDTAITDAVTEYSEDSVVDALENLSDYIDKNELTKNMGEYGDLVKQAVTGDTFGGSTRIQEAFKNFLWPED